MNHNDTNQTLGVYHATNPVAVPTPPPVHGSSYLRRQVANYQLQQQHAASSSSSYPHHTPPHHHTAHNKANGRDSKRRRLPQFLHPDQIESRHEHDPQQQLPQHQQHEQQQYAPLYQHNVNQRSHMQQHAYNPHHHHQHNRYIHRSPSAPFSSHPHASSASSSSSYNRPYHSSSYHQPVPERLNLPQRSLSESVYATSPATTAAPSSSAAATATSPNTVNYLPGPSRASLPSNFPIHYARDKASSEQLAQQIRQTLNSQQHYCFLDSDSNSNSNSKSSNNACVCPPVLGFDLEWKPNFRKGSAQNPVALMQLSTSTAAYLFQIIHYAMPPAPTPAHITQYQQQQQQRNSAAAASSSTTTASASSSPPSSLSAVRLDLASRSFGPTLTSLLLDSSILKVGVGIRADVEKLRMDYGMNVMGAVDLAHYAHGRDIALNTVQNQKRKTIPVTTQSANCQTAQPPTTASSSSSATITSSSRMDSQGDSQNDAIMLDDDTDDEHDDRDDDFLLNSSSSSPADADAGSSSSPDATAAAADSFSASLLASKPHGWSLARLFTSCFPSFELSKSKKIRLSNWEVYLSEVQKHYAALDAFVGGEIFQAIHSFYCKNKQCKEMLEMGLYYEDKRQSSRKNNQTEELVPIEITVRKEQPKVDVNAVVSSSSAIAGGAFSPTTAITSSLSSSSLSPSSSFSSSAAASASSASSSHSTGLGHEILIVSEINECDYPILLQRDFAASGMFLRIFSPPFEPRRFLSLLNPKSCSIGTIILVGFDGKDKGKKDDQHPSSLFLQNANLMTALIAFVARGGHLLIGGGEISAYLWLTKAFPSQTVSWKLDGTGNTTTLQLNRIATHVDAQLLTGQTTTTWPPALKYIRSAHMMGLPLSHALYSEGGVNTDGATLKTTLASFHHERGHVTYFGFVAPDRRCSSVLALLIRCYTPLPLSASLTPQQHEIIARNSEKIEGKKRKTESVVETETGSTTVTPVAAPTTPTATATSRPSSAPRRNPPQSHAHL